MKISLITVTYNSAATLRDTFESVLAQTYADIDYIVADGASSDGTLDIIREYMPKFEGRMRYVSERDGGMYYAMNKGLALSAGDVVGILNSDDFFTSPDVLERVAAAMADDTLDAIYGDIHFVAEGDLGRCVRTYSSRGFRPWMLRFGFMPAHPSFYCRRAVFERYGNYDTWFRVSADYEMMVRLFMVKGIRAQYLPMDFVTMRMGGASTAGFASHKAVLHDKLYSLRRNGLYTNRFFLSFIYFKKIYELIVAKFRDKES